MVQAFVNLSDHANYIINIVKAKYGLKDKSQAIEAVVTEYEENILELELRPSFIAKMRKRAREKHIKIKDFRKHYGLD